MYRVKVSVLAFVTAVFVLSSNLVMGHGNEPGTATAVIGGGKVTVEFVGPRLQGRDVMSMIESGSYWRMGADRATTLTTEVDLMFGDKRVAKGTYTLLAHFLNKDEWSLVIAEAVSQGQPQGLVAEIPGEITELDSPVEVLSIELEGNGSKGKLHLAWGSRRLTAEFSAA